MCLLCGATNSRQRISGKRLLSFNWPHQSVCISRVAAAPPLCPGNHLGVRRSRPIRGLDGGMVSRRTLFPDIFHFHFVIFCCFPGSAAARSSVPSPGPPQGRPSPARPLEPMAPPPRLQRNTSCPGRSKIGSGKKMDDLPLEKKQQPRNVELGGAWAVG